MKKRCVAMLLAGGQGSRLGILTKEKAKPAVPYGGKYRIIDFALSNCVHSDIDTVGVLTQYQPLELNAYIGNGQPWDLDRNNGGAFVLPPYVRGKKGEWYKGTANAIYQNMAFVDQYDPELVLVLSGDHIYKMDYTWMIKEHRDNNADATIAVIEVPIEEAPRFGIMNTHDDGIIYEFEEKPERPKSNTASMGVYVFNWRLLKEFLIRDNDNPKSSNDFGKDVLPLMLESGLRLYAHKFKGYWKDVGTIHSLWQANMDLIEEPAPLNLYDPQWRVYGRNPIQPPHYISPYAKVSRSMVPEGCNVYGTVIRSILFAGVYVEKGAIVEDSIVMPGSRICEGAVVRRAIIAEKAVIGKNAVIGEAPLCQGKAYAEDNDGIAVIGECCIVPEGMSIARGDVFDGTGVMV
ncbi:MAG: glucose-1-phosphate adenylyltransferase [Christensenellales bacterium]|jgi:glucose-1-phosphate adenylyltransferase